MRQFESEVILGLPQLTDAEFRAFEERVLASYAEHQQEQQHQQDNEEEDRLDREWASSVLAASLPQQQQQEEPAIEVVSGEEMYNQVFRL